MELGRKDLNDFSPQENIDMYLISIRENIAIGIRPDEIDNTAVSLNALNEQFL